jgi:hypothetical protein
LDALPLGRTPLSTTVAYWRKLLDEGRISPILLSALQLEVVEGADADLAELRLFMALEPSHVRIVPAREKVTTENWRLATARASMSIVRSRGEAMGRVVVSFAVVACWVMCSLAPAFAQSPQEGDLYDCKDFQYQEDTQEGLDGPSGVGC